MKFVISFLIAGALLMATPTQVKVPEPVSLALVGGALLAFGSFFRHRPRPQPTIVHVPSKYVSAPAPV